MIHVINTDGTPVCGETVFLKENLHSAYEFYTYRAAERCAACHQMVSGHLTSFVGWGRIVYDRT